MFESPSLSQIISAARDYIADPEHFVEGWRHNGKRVCAIGAFQKVVGYHRDDFDCTPGESHPLWEAFHSKMTKAAVQLYPKSEAAWPMYPYVYVNNHLGHAAILSVFDLAARIE